MDNALYKNDSDYAGDYAVTHYDFMAEKSLSGMPNILNLISNPLYEPGFQSVPRSDPGYFELTTMLSPDTDLQGTSAIDFSFPNLCGKSFLTVAAIQSAVICGPVLL